MNIKNYISSFLGQFSVFNVSGDYRVIDLETAKRMNLDNQWKDDNLPYKQLKIVKKQIADIKKKRYFPPHILSLIKLLRKTELISPKILEIGCSSGYYSEILKLANLDVRYEGCDYSEAFIKLARELYPLVNFKVCDATKLAYNNQEFDIVISGCCILHILNYTQAITEAIRTAKKYVIFSRTPIVLSGPTVYTKKSGYELPMIEIFFNEQEIINICKKNSMNIVENEEIDDGPDLNGIKTKNISYLFKKKN